MSSKTLAKKAKVVEALTEKIGASNILLLADYRGFSVKEMTQLRQKLRRDEAELKIVKNTLLKRALAAAGFNGLESHLQGTTALLMGYKDPIGPLKTLVAYIKEIEKGSVRAGLLEKALVDNKGIIEISQLPSKEQLIAQVVGGFKSPLFGLANVLQGPLRKLVYVLKAVQEKKGV